MATAFLSSYTACPNTSIRLYGHADYVGSFDENTYVTGAEVRLTIIETGKTYTGYTNSNGDYSIYFTTPGAFDYYTVVATVTDFTLITEIEAQVFNVKDCPPASSGPKGPDLAINYSYWNDIHWTSECRNINENIDVTAYFYNIGNMTAKDILVYVYRDDELYLTFTYDSLQAGKLQRMDFPISFATAGNHSVRITLDPLNSIVELAEYNNSGSRSRYIYPPYPDLSPTDIRFSNNSPYEDDEINLTFLVKNLNCTSSEPVKANIYHIFGDEISLLATIDVPIAGKLQYAQAYLYNQSFAQTGWHEIRIIVDPGNELYETNENNQMYSEQFFVKEKISELAISDISFSVYNPNINDQINFTTTVWNNGSAPASDFYIHFYVDNQLIGDPVLINDLPVGTNILVTSAPWKVSDCGHTVVAMVDTENTVRETNEYNNQTSRNIGTDFHPALWPYYYYSNISVLVGTTVNIRSRIHNLGTLDADTIPVSYVVDNQLLELDVVPNIKHGSYAASNVLHTFKNVGDYTVAIMADRVWQDSTRFCELREDNNVTYLHVHVYGEKPDLQVLSQHISPTELNPDPDEPIDIYASFENKGNVPSGPFWVKFYMNSELWGDSLYVSTMLAHEDSTVACTKQFSSELIGSHIIRVRVDENEQVTEYNEMNNEASRAVIVGDAPDLMFSDAGGIWLSNPSPTEGELITIVGVVENNGGATGTGKLNYFVIEDADTTFINFVEFTAKPLDSIDVQLQWYATTQHGKIYLVITDSDPDEFNTFNNSEIFEFGTALPTVVKQSSSRSAYIGDDVFFDIFAIGGDLTYQWQKDGLDILMADNDTLTINSVLLGNTGKYICNVTNDLGSVSTDTIYLTVEEPPSISLSFDIKNASCYQTTDGKITVTAEGGIGVYTFQWNDEMQQTTQMATNLKSGTYKVIATDEEGNQIEGEATITDPPPLQVAVAALDASCGQNDGTVWVENITGAHGNYSFIWDGNAEQNTQTLEGLSAGSYVVEVSSQQCTASAVAYVGNLLSPAINKVIISNVTGCYGGTNGSIEIFAEGGTNNLYYSINGGENFTEIYSFNALSAGSYKITVKDNSNCITFGDEIQLQQPQFVEIIETEYTNILCFETNNGVIDIQAKGGTGNLLYSIDGGNNYLENNGLFTNLMPNTYNIKIKDQNACESDISTITIDEAIGLVINSVNVHNISCSDRNDGQIEINASGGTGVLNYSIDGDIFTENSVFEQLTEGIYTITVRDENYCEASYQNQQITRPETLIIESIDITKALCKDEFSSAINITASGGVSPYQFAINGFDYSANPVFDKIKVGLYDVSVTDSRGCVVNQEVDVLYEEIIVDFDYSVTDKSVDFTPNVNGDFSLNIWNFGNGHISTLPNPTYEYVEDNEYNVCYSVYNRTSGCIGKKCKTIGVGNFINKANFSYVVDSPAKTLTLTDESNGDITLRIWKFGDGFISRDQNPIHVYENTGDYEVCLSVYDRTTREFSQHCKEIRIERNDCKLKAEIQHFVDTENNKIILIDKSAGNPTGRFWTTGDGGSSAHRFMVHNYERGGFYRIKLVVRDSLKANCIDRDIEMVQVGNAGCRAKFDYFVDTDTRTVTFRNLSTRNTTDWFWKFGDGQKATEQTPEVTYSKVGGYKVILTSMTEDGTCSDRYETIIDIENAACKASFVAYVDSVKQKVHFKNTSNAKQAVYFWQFGDGGTASVQNPVYQYSHKGYYDVQLTVYSEQNSCIDKYSETIIFGSEDIDCEVDFDFVIDGAQIKFNAKSTGGVNKYVWNMGDGGLPQQGENIAYSYLESGVYNVCLTGYTENGIQNFKCKNVPTPDQQQFADIDFMYAVLNDYRTVIFADASPFLANSWLWNFDNSGSSNATSTEQYPEFTYNSADFYMVALSLQSTNYGGTAHRLVNVGMDYKGVKADFVYQLLASDNKYGGYPIEMAGAAFGDPAKINWNFGDGKEDSTATKLTHLYENEGTYTVCFTVTDPISGEEDVECKSVWAGEVDVEHHSLSSGKLSVYPNPTVGKSTITFSIPSKMKVNLTLFDVLGNKIEDIITDTYYTDTNNIEWKTTHLKAGVYFMKMQTLYGEIVRKVIRIE